MDGLVKDVVKAMIRQAHPLGWVYIVHIFMAEANGQLDLIQIMAQLYAMAAIDM